GARALVRVLGGGAGIGLAPPPAAQESGRARGGTPSLPQDIGAWLHIAEDGRVTVFTGKVEIGQNIRTSLAQQVAEELSVPVEAIDCVMGDTERVPWDAGTVGSRTTPTMAPQLKAAAAAARTLLVEMAAERLKVDKASLSVEAGRVVERSSGRALRYGELTRGAKLVRLVGAGSEAPPLTPATGWTVAGTATAKAHRRDFVTG